MQYDILSTDHIGGAVNYILLFFTSSLFGIYGSFILAQEAIRNPRGLISYSLSNGVTFGGGSIIPGKIIQGIEHKIDSLYGITALVIGFTLQMIGYIFSLLPDNQKAYPDFIIIRYISTSIGIVLLYRLAWKFVRKRYRVNQIFKVAASLEQDSDRDNLLVTGVKDELYMPSSIADKTLRKQLFIRKYGSKIAPYLDYLD